MKRLLTPALALLAISCGQKKDAPSAKTEMEGKVVFSMENFDDAKKYKTLDEFKKVHKVVDELVVTAPGVSLRYYAVFKERLGEQRYIVQVFDKTDMAPAKVEEREATPSTGQITGGWTFDVPEWPVPADGADILVNNVWIKPGHRYEVVILKPMASGEFRVADAPPPVEVKKETAAAKKKKGKGG